MVCISLIINNTEYLSCAFGPSVCLLWGNVYLGLISFFKNLPFLLKRRNLICLSTIVCPASGTVVGT